MQTKRDPRRRFQLFVRVAGSREHVADCRLMSSPISELDLQCQVLSSPCQIHEIGLYHDVGTFTTLTIVTINFNICCNVVSTPSSPLNTTSRCSEARGIGVNHAPKTPQILLLSAISSSSCSFWSRYPLLHRALGLSYPTMICSLRLHDVLAVQSSPSSVEDPTATSDPSGV